MLKGTKKYYESLKNKEMLEDDGSESHITHVHVFHKEYPRLPSVELPDTYNPDSELQTLLDMQESTRFFSDTPLKLEEIAKIIRSCRITDYRRIPEKRSYPSGGARFPVELYIVSFNVKDLAPGAYHYNIKKGNLEQLWKKDLKDRRRELISPYLENPAASLVLTSVISRSEVKYGLRAYPYSLIEAGHMGQNIQLTCAEIGIGSCSVSGFVDDTFKEILDLTNDEIPIYSICIGRRGRK